jgi:Fe-Mn family superoxide dismutase
VGHPAGCNPILVLDVFEHAYMIDYGLKKMDYVNNYFKKIKWDVVEKRLETA